MDDTQVKTNTPKAEAGTENLYTVSEVQKKDAEEKARMVAGSHKETVDEIQANLKKNKVYFYGLPFLVIAYGLIVVFLFVVPSLQTYLKTLDSIKMLEKNLSNFKTTATNLNNARSNISEYNKYETSLKSYIPTESQLGTLIDVIQKKADDYSLEGNVAAPSQDSTSTNSTINSLTTRSVDDNAIFDSINSGVIKFVPKSLSSDSDARLLAIDVNISGTKNNFFKFLKEMEETKPIMNLVYVDYMESTPDANTGEAKVKATLRFESYTLKLDSSASTTTTKYGAKDRILLTPISPESFNLNTSIIEAFGNQ